MPHPDALMGTWNAPSASAFRSLAEAFQPTAVVPPVPAVELTRTQWDDICFVLREVGALESLVAPHDLAVTLIQGKAVHEAASKARDLVLRLGLDSETR